MGDHDAPVSWLERWRETEPVRLYLWGIAGAVIPASVVAGWLTSELAVAITGVVAAVLMVGGARAARQETYAPATVTALRDQWQAETDELLDEQHELSWQEGVAAAVAGREQVERTPAQVAAETRQLVQQSATPRERLPRCKQVEDGRRCLLPEHPDTFPHRLEEEAAPE